MFKSRRNDSSVIGGVFIAFFILIFHVALLALIGVVVLFLSGLLSYLPWILLGGLVLLAGSGYLIVRRLAKNSESLVRFLNLPELRGKNIELKVLGGLASLKISGSGDSPRMLDCEDDFVARDEVMQEKKRLVE